MSAAGNTASVAADQEIMERRARELARPPAEAVTEDTIDVVDFQIAGERYAVAAREVLAVFALGMLAPLPGAVPPIAGVTVWRGRLLTLLDVRAALGLPASALNDLRAVIVLGDARGTAGILVDALLGITTRRAGDFRDTGTGGERGAYIGGIASDAVMLINGAALAHQHTTRG